MRHSYGIENITRLWSNEDSRLIIGSFCSIADHVTVFLGGNHRVDWVTTYPFGHINHSIFNKFDGTGHPKSNGDVIIGNDVWIGSKSTIMSGITIGDGAVISANAHVTKDVPPYAIVGGNPARVIRKRFTESQIIKLLKISWWNWDDEKINENIQLLCNPNIDQFIDYYYPIKNE